MKSALVLTRTWTPNKDTSVMFFFFFQLKAGDKLHYLMSRLNLDLLGEKSNTIVMNIIILKEI